MSTSNSYNYNQTRNEIISDALQLLGAYNTSDTIAANDITLSNNILNKMVKAWQGQGIHLWTESEGTLFFTSGINKYSITSSSTNSGDSVVETTGTASGGATSISVVSASGMNISDNIVIEQDDGTTHTTTITNIVGTGLTLNTATTAACTGGRVWVFTTVTGKPLVITDARLRNNAQVDRYIEKQGRVEFMRQPTKETSTGSPTAFYYSPGRDSGTLYVFPTPTDVSECLKFTYVRSIQDFDASSDNPDFPQEWLEAITYNLAIRLAPAFGISLSKTNPDLIGLAARSLDEMKAWDFEEGSVKLVPNHRWD